MNNSEPMNSASHRRYNKSLKSAAIELLNSGKPVADIARILSINAQSLYHWKKELKQKKIETDSSSVDLSVIENSQNSVSLNQNYKIENLKFLIKQTEDERDRLKQAIIIILESLP